LNLQSYSVIGKSIKITARGNNCHHLALFVNGEWVKTVYGEMNTNHINLEYEYEIPDVGDYTIQVKGRNIPGNKGGILEKSEIIEIEGFIPDRKFAENIWVYLEMIEDYQAIIDAGNATLLGAECSTIEEVETYKLNLRHVVQYLQYELIENPLVRDNSVVSKYIAQKIIYGDKIDLADDLFIRQQLRANNSVIDEVFGEYVDKMWQEYKDMIIDALPGVISMGLNFVPIIGTLKSVAEGIVGYDLITKNEFAWWERALNIGLAPISFASEVGMLSAAMKNAKLLPKLTDIANIAGDVKVMAIIDKIGAIKTSLKSAPEKIFQKVKSVISKGDDLKIITTDGLELRFSETQLVAELRAGGMTDDAAKSAVRCLKNKCFSGDTLVTTKDGLKRIDQIQEGEMVLSKDVNTGTIDYRQVRHVYVKSTYEFVHLTLENEEIRTTASHLFFTDSGWWKAAENLKYGDRILNNKGEYETLIESSLETLQKPEKIYNLNVDEFHTYFVGSQGLLVHNDCTLDMMAAGREAIEAGRALNITDSRVLSDIGSTTVFSVQTAIKQGITDSTELARIGSEAATAVTDTVRKVGPKVASRVQANAIDAHEYMQALEIAEFRQGERFVGNSVWDAPGIDGTLNGVNVSLKEYTGGSVAGVLTHASRAETSALNAGYKGIDLYVNAKGVPTPNLIDYANTGNLAKITTQGIITNIYVQTSEGWVKITNGIAQLVQ